MVPEVGIEYGDILGHERRTPPGRGGRGEILGEHQGGHRSDAPRSSRSVCVAHDDVRPNLTDETRKFLSAALRVDRNDRRTQMDSREPSEEIVG